MKEMSLKNGFREIEHIIKPLMQQHIADQKVDLIFHDFLLYGGRQVCPLPTNILETFKSVYMVTDS